MHVNCSRSIFRPFTFTGFQYMLRDFVIIISSFILHRMFGVIHVLRHTLGSGESGGALQSTMIIVTKALRGGWGFLKIGQISVS